MALKRFFSMVMMLGIGIMPLFVNIAQDEEPPPVTDGQGVTIHVVQRGENLYRISLAYDVTMDDLIEINGILDPSSLEVGQRLLIPLDPLETEAIPLTHIVQAGESLGRIAEYYDTTMEELIALNEIVNPNSIYVGQELIVRSYGGTPPPSESVAPTESSVIATLPIGESVTHVVQSGETLFSIARNYGLDVVVVQTANNIADPTLIYAGQALIIPNVQAPDITIDLPDSLVSLNITPLLLSEGRTGRLELVTEAPATVTLTFLNQNIPLAVYPDGVTQVAFIPIPVWTVVNVYPLTLRVMPESGGEDVVNLNMQVVSGGFGSQYITLPDDRLDLLNPAVEENEMTILRTVASQFTSERYFNDPFGLPAAAAMNSPFGTNRAYNGNVFDRYHTGADFAGAPGSTVYSASAGRIVLADTLNIRGVTVMIDHGWGVYTVYAHLADRYANIGDFVQAGQPIGTVGSSGRATGAHLHWELWVNGVPVDPMQWVREAFP